MCLISFAESLLVNLMYTHKNITTFILQFTLPALIELKKQGKVRYIGITGYNLGVLKRIVMQAPPQSIDMVLSYSRYEHIPLYV